MKGGHSKGVLASNDQTGFWLIHSVPKFPDLTAASFTWTASHEFGQSFLCLSVKASDVENIAKNLQYSYVRRLPQCIFVTVWSGTCTRTRGTCRPLSRRSSPTCRTPPTARVWTAQASSPSASAVPCSNPTPNRPAGTTTCTLPPPPTHTPFIRIDLTLFNRYQFLVEPDLNIAKGMMWETWRRSPFEDKFCKGSTYKYNSLNVEMMKLDGFDPFKYATFFPQCIFVTCCSGTLWTTPSGASVRRARCPMSASVTSTACSRSTRAAAKQRALRTLTCGPDSSKQSTKSTTARAARASAHSLKKLLQLIIATDARRTVLPKKNSLALLCPSLPH